MQQKVMRQLKADLAADEDRKVLTVFDLTDKSLKDQLGRRIRYLRGAALIPQAALAGQIGTSESDVDLIERGRYRLTEELVLALATALQTTIHDLFKKSLRRNLYD